jgi:hypothetical protein
MPSPEEIHEQQERLAIHRRTLAHYLKQEAALSAANTRPEISHGIHDARTKIAHIKAVLRGWGVDVEDHPNDAESFPSNYTKTEPHQTTHNQAPNQSAEETTFKRKEHSLNRIGDFLKDHPIPAIISFVAALITIYVFIVTITTPDSEATSTPETPTPGPCIGKNAYSEGQTKDKLCLDSCVASELVTMLRAGQGFGDIKAFIGNAVNHTPSDLMVQKILEPSYIDEIEANSTNGSGLYVTVSYDLGGDFKNIGISSNCGL